MRAAGLVIVEHALAHGCIRWAPDGRTVDLYLSNDADTIQAARPHRQTIEAVLRRAVAFHRQLSIPHPEPFCRFREVRWCQAGTCPSCGGPVGEHEFLRCDLCALGVALALAAPKEVERRAEERRG